MALFLLTAAMLSGFAIRQHLALQTGFDLGVYTQVLWTTAHGRPFYQTLMEGTTNFLTLHFVPLVAVLAPIYAIWPDARALLILQSILLAAAALPLWAFARPRLGPTVAFLLALAYCLSPLLHFVALADFHEIALAVPLLMAAGAALLDKRPRATFIWLGLALLVKEEIALVALGFGLYALFVQRRWRFGAALLAFGVAWAILLATVLMPTLLSNGGGSNFARHYGALGGTPGQILRTLVTDPLAAARVILTPGKLRFLWQLVAPLAFLPIVGLPVSLLMLPSLAYLLLGGDGFLTSIEHHYTAVLIPFLFLSTAWGLHRIRRWKPRAATIAASILVPKRGPVINVSAGSVLPVWMAWGADAPIGRQIAFTLHLVDDNQGTVAQIDQEMGAGRFPTTEWRTWVTNPVVVSEFPLQIPPGTPPGEYTLLAGAYDAKTVTPLVQPGKWEPWVPLTRVVVQP